MIINFFWQNEDSVQSFAINNVVIDIYDNIANNNNHKLMMVLGLVGCNFRFDRLF